MARRLRSLSILLCTLLTSFQSLAADEMPPTPIETQKIQFQEITHGIWVTGELKANRSIIIKSEVPGKVVNLPLQEGQQVSAGTLLVALDDLVAKANLKQAEAKYEHSKLNYERIKTLSQKGTGSESEKDSALSNLRTDEANLALAKAALAKTQLKAPFTGTLGLRKVDIGDYVSPGEPLITLDDINALLVDFSVPEKYLQQIKLNQTIDVSSDTLPHQKFQAQIYAIAPQIDTVTHAIKARAKLNNQGTLLRPGLFVKLRVIFNRNPKGIFVPEQAIVFQGSKTLVYLVENNQVTLHEVKTGIHADGQVEVISGLHEGAVIAKTGQSKLFPGAKVMDVGQLPK